MSGLVPAAAIGALIRDCMQAVGLPPADAAKVAELMVEADLTGADAHGVFRLPQYVRRIKGGGVNPKANITVEQTAAATAMVDGDNGMGHLVMTRAAATAITLAKQTGVAWVGAQLTKRRQTPPQIWQLRPQLPKCRKSVLQGKRRKSPSQRGCMAVQVFAI